MNKKKKDVIRVIGAREHNLKNIDIEIPKNSFTVITGPSGSGKSSLALDILYTEGKRRYTESLSAYARQFLGIARKPDVDQIIGLCPSIAIEQKTVSANPRSTVGTITEIYDYMRVFYARIGTPHCPSCGQEISQESPEKVTALITNKFKNKEIVIAAPLAHEKKGEFQSELIHYFNNGYHRFIIDGKRYRFNSLAAVEELGLKKTHKHSIDLLIDVVTVLDNEKVRINEGIEKAFELSSGKVKIITADRAEMTEALVLSSSKDTSESACMNEYVFSSDRMCVPCGKSFPELEPRLFSFNSPIGACKKCHGLGTIHEWPWQYDDRYSRMNKGLEHYNKYVVIAECPDCKGKRLNEFALSVKINKKTLDDLVNMPIRELLVWFKKLRLAAHEMEIAQSVIKEIMNRLGFLNDVGLAYLTLNRSARTLSGGEGQRIRLATQIGSALSGVLYILDEPSIGLHQRDNQRLIKTLKSLRDQGNTVLVVEHDIDTIKSADHLIDMGPAAGVHGGRVTAQGSPLKLRRDKNSLTGAYLSGKRAIAVPDKIREPRCFITLYKLTKNNLKEESVKFPLGVFCSVSGVSGSGKSTLVIEELVPALEREFNKPYSSKTAQHYFNNHESYIEGAQSLHSLVVIDQSPIGRTPRSNPATYLGMFDEIRHLYARLPESRARGYQVGRFSFNVADGRCFECRGEGEITVSMHFLADVTVECKVCKGKRYNKQTLEIKYNGKTIYDVLEMTAFEALEFFSAYPSLKKRLQLMCDVGLDYLKLGQPATTLSGGEAQRIKLVRELAKRGSDTIYILDEPTTGLHNADIEKLLKVLNRLVDKGNSIIVIEHNLDVLRASDYIIDLGPEGGDEGGYVMAQGSPNEIIKSEKSFTAKYLKLSD
ncbi:TPA: excinuclease ABC subunit A [Candidatus Dependentiae bacterium]|nr:MAG: Excinuclease ABC, subunit A [candidate division TM6 bacterium GW2011_GWF2_36_131]KKQ03269.1 MAG: Excinuclease ABC, subunit A [candidate division TM6 bacterium GW2011_GWE2_36_25]KKQ19191.1 MAG: Excinuclease ABC, subunit A [candidate division TM6 bacterium GW2011_GWA2_36_9]HBR70303.1 excinuclease ABC subunit A [Candidatus Dependentiae bacterium]HCU00848.1 excinuclease ABC subunit A [Candidatus Dependentiae bacterium]